MHQEEYLQKIKKLKNLPDVGLKPSIYDNPKFTPHPFQKIGIAFLYLIKRGLLGDSVGLGKTLQSIYTINRIIEKNPNARIIVVVPKSALKQWLDEGFNKFSQGLDITVVGNKEKYSSKQFKNDKEYRENKYQQWKQILLISYPVFIRDWKTSLEPMVSKRDFNLSVFYDEAALFKSRNSSTHKVCRALSFVADRAYGITATVIKNRLDEAHSVFRVIVPGLMPTVKEFQESFCELKKIYGVDQPFPVYEITGYKNLDKFRDLIDPYYIGRKKSDVAQDLPTIRTVQVPFELDRKTAGTIHKLYDLIKKYKAKLRDNPDEEPPIYQFPNGHESQVIPLTIFGLEQQLVDDPRVLGYDEISPKIEWVLEQFDGDLANEKVLIHCWYKEVVNNLAAELEKKGIKVGRITGEISLDDRERYRKEFQEGDLNVVIFNAAGSEALNLQAAGYIIFYDAPWSIGGYVQSLGRAHRIGSKHDNLVVYHLVTEGTIDDDKFRLLESKLDLVEKIFGSQEVMVNYMDESFVKELEKMLDERLKH